MGAGVNSHQLKLYPPEHAPLFQHFTGNEWSSVTHEVARELAAPRRPTAQPPGARWPEDESERCQAYKREHSLHFTAQTRGSNDKQVNPKHT